MKIFISPSTQEHNAYITGGTEEGHMRPLCLDVATILRAAGHEVKVGGTVSAADNVAMANAWGAQLYTAVHTDAGGATGTKAFFYSGSALGKRLAEAIYARVAPISPGADGGVRANDGLIEIHGPKAPACLVELAPHDIRNGALSIDQHSDDYAKAVAEGILAIAGRNVVEPVVSEPCFWVWGVVPSTNKTACVAELKALGIYVSVKAGVSGYAILEAHTRQGKQASVESVIGKHGIKAFVLQSRVGDHTTRELNPATGKYIG